MLAEKGRKLTAAFFLVVLVTELITPTFSYALTSGPSQPEMQKFEPAGASDLVDLFSGDLKYNIPLLDVGGYPVNLSYSSGTGMEDEVSWVGAGWSLNPGAINRTMRGLPDDFDGSAKSDGSLISDEPDVVTKESHRKEFNKVSAQLTIKPSLFAWEKGAASVKVNVYKDNYYGMGASIGAGVDFSLASNTKTGLTAGLGLDVNSDVRNGVEVSPNFSIEREFTDKYEEPSARAGLSGSLAYNTRGGLKSTTLGASFSTIDYDNNSFTYSMSGTKYYGQSYTPSISTNSSNTGYTFSIDLGGTAFGVFAGVGGAGSYYAEKDLQPTVTMRPFGYMNYTKGRADINALLDFNREKDGPFLPSAPAIPLPVATQDFFTASSQAGGQQFRPYYNGNYIVFDNRHVNTSANTSLGITLGLGNTHKVGGRASHTSGGSESMKWVENNGYLSVGDAVYSGLSLQEPVSLRPVGEKTRKDPNQDYLNAIGTDAIRKVAIAGNTTLTALKDGGNITYPITQPLKKSRRDKRVTAISYLTAGEANKYGLDKSVVRVNSGRQKKAHHISECTVTGADGMRTVYSLPAYNLSQTEATFSKAPKDAEELASATQTGLVKYNTTDASSSNQNGRDWTFNKQTTSGYATSFLISGILSPDYVDKTNDGISDDDAGTAVKFNYQKLGDQQHDYQWRAPFQKDKANYNEGFLSDPKDDKASYVYGKKEVWYLTTIESKTMIAIFNVVDRPDGMGVLGETGGINTAFHLKKLDNIQLFSKADWKKNGSAATPVKTVHFVYDNSLFRGIPNSEENLSESGDFLVNTDAMKGGKLTLTKVYFTFGKSTRGESNPYEFSYDLRPVNDGSLPQSNIEAEKNDLYAERQTDRWGTYKQSFYNHLVNGAPVINNSEFPYVPQEDDNTSYSERAMADRLASKWQLNRIVTPTGSIISVDYESDDYAYVQNKRAMQMCFIKGIGTAAPENGVATGLINADQIAIALPERVNSYEEFIDKYLKQADGTPLNKLFYKVFADVDGRGHYEYVNGYATVELPTANDVKDDGHTMLVTLKKINDKYNPIASSGWQLLRTSLPQYAYDNYDNSDIGGDLNAAIRSLITAIGNLRELVQPFETRAQNRHFSDAIQVNKSMVRLFQPDYIKIGGGARVKKVQISDEWKAMTGLNDDKTSIYGQLYSYKMKKGNDWVSSGVASYEPQIGNEENPFHEPIEFTEKVHWSSDKYHFIEKPFGETYFPGPSVGYSRVTVTPFGNDYDPDANPQKKPTGETVSEFYTARDFPTLVEYLPLEQNKYESSTLLKLFTCTYTNKMATSQGFKISLNDMHGKPRSVKIYNSGGDLISSNEYYYHVKDNNAEEKELDNEVDVLNTDSDGADYGASFGKIAKTTIGMDIDFVTDVRQSRNESVGGSVGAYVGGTVTFIPFFPYLPYVAANADVSISREYYNSVSVVKVVHQFGLLERTKVMQNGSTIETANLLWDGETGETLLTRTQNEFDKNTYAFSYPAYMTNEGMGAAYKNIGTLLFITPTGGNGNIDAFKDYLVPGDELISVNTRTSGLFSYWVIRSSDGLLHMIDENGGFGSVSDLYRVYRSGRRNMLGASAGTVVTMTDPRVNGMIDLSVARKVLDARATLYKDEWGVPIARPCATCPDGYTLSEDGTTCHQEIPAQQTPGDFMLCASASSEFSSCGTLVYENVAYPLSSLPPYSRHLVETVDVWKGSAICNLDFDYWPWPAARVAASSDTTGTARVSPGVALDGPLNYCGIVPCNNNQTPQPVTDWLSFSYTVSTASGHYYYVGIASTGLYRVKVDGVTVAGVTDCNDAESFKLWRTLPIYVQPGTHTIMMEGKLCGGSPQAFGAEIYDNSQNDIRFANSRNDLNVLFSTRNLRGTSYGGIYACPEGYTLNTSNNTCSRDIAIPPVGGPFVFNPYFSGVLGNWRPWVNYVYAVNRDQKAGNSNQNGGTDIRNNGYYTTFTPFWRFDNKALMHSIEDTRTSLTPQDNRWVWNAQGIYFDSKGNATEEVDPLYRYNASLFGYDEAAVIAVAQNARRNEVAFDGFEDYNFRPQNAASNLCPFYQFDFGLVKNNNEWSNNAGKLIATSSHSGKYCYQFNSAVNVSKSGGADRHPNNILGYDIAGRYQLISNEQQQGFSPIPGKKYVLSLWVNDRSPKTNTVGNLTVRINGTDVGVSGKVVPVVEGWKRLELTFTAAENFALELVPSGTILMDDFRIFPFDAHMQTYSYDESNMRLQAQLDENNFATFYEYDDEGTPIRVKKETERGIMTLKETRQSYRSR